MTVSSIEIHPGDESARKLWEAVARLAIHLGPQGWCLVGGLMVQLHAYEHAANPRPTGDIDLLGDARARPSATEHIGKTIDELGGELIEPAHPFGFYARPSSAQSCSRQGRSASTVARTTSEKTWSCS